MIIRTVCTCTKSRNKLLYCWRLFRPSAKRQALDENNKTIHVGIWFVFKIMFRTWAEKQDDNSKYQMYKLLLILLKHTSFRISP